VVSCQPEANEADRITDQLEACWAAICGAFQLDLCEAASNDNPRQLDANAADLVAVHPEANDAAIIS
jgi:hypothetical protein